MTVQSFQHVERFSDAAWTMLRFCLTVVPAIICGLLLANAFPIPHELMTQESPEFVRSILLVLELLVIGPTAAGITFFVLLQCGARSPLPQPAMQTWLAVHGWDGSAIRSPYRTSVPVTEWICLVGTTAFCVYLAPSYFVLIPMTWAIMRLALVIVRMQRLSTTMYGTLAVLVGIALLFLNLWWISLPSVLLIMAIALKLEAVAMRQLADKLMMTDLAFAVVKNSSRNRQTTASSQQRIFPFHQLRPDVVDGRSEWRQALLISSILTWLTFCLFVRIGETIANVGSMSDANGTRRPEDAAFGAIVFMGVVAGASRILPGILGCWLPRLGPISRIITARPIVPSYDCVLKPILLACGVSLFIKFLPGEFWFAKFLAAEFLMLLIVLRCGPSDEEFQMTADARLSSWFMTQK